MSRYLPVHIQKVMLLILRYSMMKQGVNHLTNNKKSIPVMYTSVIRKKIYFYLLPFKIKLHLGWERFKMPRAVSLFLYPT